MTRALFVVAVAGVCALLGAVGGQAVPLRESDDYVTAPSVTAPRSVGPGKPFVVTAGVRNIGDARSAQGTSLKLYLSSDYALGAGDALLATAAAGGIAPGGSRTVQIRVVAPARQGAYVVMVCRTPAPTGKPVCGYSPTRLIVGSSTQPGPSTPPAAGPQLVAGAFTWNGTPAGIGFADGQFPVDNDRRLRLRYAFRSSVRGPISVRVWLVLEKTRPTAPCTGSPQVSRAVRSGTVGTSVVTVPADGRYAVWLRVADARGGLYARSRCARAAVTYELDATPPPTPRIERFRPANGGFVLQVNLTYRTPAEKQELRVVGATTIEYFTSCPTYAAGQGPAREREGLIDKFRAFGPVDADATTAFLRVSPATGGRDRFQDGDALPSIRMKDAAGNVSGCVLPS